MTDGILLKIGSVQTRRVITFNSTPVGGEVDSSLKNPRIGVWNTGEFMPQRQCSRARLIFSDGFPSKGWSRRRYRRGL